MTPLTIHTDGIALPPLAQEKTIPTRRALVILALSLLALLTAAVAPVAPVWLTALSLPACPTEDADNCRWIAQWQGNGEGLSFYVIDGAITYLP